MKIDLKSLKRMLEGQAQRLTLDVPPMLFEVENRLDSLSKEDDKEKFRTFTIKLDPNKKHSDTIEKHVRVFNDGTPKEWVKFRQNLADLTKEIPLRTFEHLQKAVDTLLLGKNRVLFRASVNDRLTVLAREMHAEQEALTDDDRKLTLELALNDVAKNVFVTPNAERRQKFYLRHYCFKTDDMSVRDFSRTLFEYNQYLEFFPYDEKKEHRPKPMPNDELADILNRAKPVRWHLDMLGANIDPYDFEFDAFQDYLERLEIKDSLERANKKRKAAEENDSDDKSSGKRKNKRKKTSDSKDKKSTDKKCKHCGKSGHKEANCWELEANKARRPKNWKSVKTSGFSTEELNTMIANLPIFKESKNKKKKRKVHYEKEDSESEEAANFINQLQSTTKSSNKSYSDCDSLYSSFSVEQSSDSVEHMFHMGFNPEGKDSQKRSKVQPELIVEVTDAEGQKRPIRALLDTGTTATILLRKFVAPGRANGYKKKPTQWWTMGGVFTTRRKALIDFKLPDFNVNKTVHWKCHVDDKSDPEKAQYDMIIGTDLMSGLGIDIQFSDHTLAWEDETIPLRPRGTLAVREKMEAIYHHLEIDPDGLHDFETRFTKILDADYSAINMDEHIDSLDYLSSAQRENLKGVLAKYPTLTKGGLGKLSIPPVHLELRENAKPFHARAFPIPKYYYDTTRKEIDRFCEIGVLEKNHDSEWGAPSFIRPKKTGDVRVVTDFRQLNVQLKRKQFPLPKISDLLQRLEGFTYATAIDLSMGYYNVPIDEYSQRLCTTVLPWGKYRYKRLPMGIGTAPDIFQAVMTNLFDDMEFAQAYLDDILITSSGDYNDHMQKVDKVLARLTEAGFRINVKKSFFAKSEIEYLGYWLTRDGIQPQPKKVEAILRLTPPTTKRQVRHFLGMVNYYRDTWRRRSHLLAPLTDLTKKDVKFHWGSREQAAFDAIKAVISKETLLSFPDFNKPFHIWTDASDYQLGAVIMQDDKPLAFYSRKLNSAQSRYTTGEKELLSIVETLKEFRTILLGYNIIVHTDHKNLLYGKLSNDRLIRWRLLIEEYGAEFVHVSGTSNVVADALSRLDYDDEMEVAHLLTDDVVSYLMTDVEVEDEVFPLNAKLVAKCQHKDKALKSAMSNDSTQYSIRNIEGTDVIHLKDKIVVPFPLRNRVVAWYHEYLCHPGETRLEATLRQTLTWPGMRDDVKRYCQSCHKCQLNKKTRRNKYGQLPAREVDVEPWKRVNIDVIGPYTIPSKSKRKRKRSKSSSPKMTLSALTMIDPATNWFEIKYLKKVDSEHVMEAFHEQWLCRYPRPAQVGFDNGTEFKFVFKELCANFNLKSKPTTNYNPQGNSIIERVHQVIGDSLRTLQIRTEDLEENADLKLEGYLATVAWAIRSTYHTTLSASPGQLVFGRDMLLPIRFQIDWDLIRTRKELKIQKANTRENARRYDYDYQPGAKVLLSKPGIIPKLDTPRTGPYVIESVHTNGTVRIRKGLITERVNVRRLIPYREPNH